jgi:hypothetical protein
VVSASATQTLAGVGRTPRARSELMQQIAEVIKGSDWTEVEAAITAGGQRHLNIDERSQGPADVARPAGNAS